MPEWVLRLISLSQQGARKKIKLFQSHNSKEAKASVFKTLAKNVMKFSTEI